MSLSELTRTLQGERKRKVRPSASATMHAPPALSSDDTRRRGCNCKRSNCLKLYCDCFASDTRCGDQCQCIGCKNKDDHRHEIAHAIQAIEQRTQKSFRSPTAAAAARLETLRAAPTTGFQTKPADAQRVLVSAMESSHGAPVTPPVPSRTVDAASRASGRPLRIPCSCRDGICRSECPCLTRFGGCIAGCPCRGCQPLKKQEKTKGCSCKKSGCLKLYCECLAANQLCDSRCNCEGCKNRPEHHAERERAIANILDRNPMAFQPKVASGTSQHLRGCNCRKSGCMKNYCECHQAGVPCTSRCACHQCRNTEPSVSAKKTTAMGSGTPLSTAPTGSTAAIEQRQRAGRRLMRKPPVGIQPQLLSASSSGDRRLSALELLSRSAAPALQTATSSKRSASPALVRAPVVPKDAVPTYVKRKYSKVDASSLRKSHETIGDNAKIVGGSVQRLPVVDATVDKVYGLGTTEAPSMLTKLCRSLLSAAAAVDQTAVPTPRRAAKSSDRYQAENDGSFVKDDDDDRESRGGSLSPGAQDLLCDEDMDEHGDDEGSSQQRQSSQESAGSVGSQGERKRKTSAMQERAVLQEFSVWLRNRTARTLSTDEAAQ